MALSQQAQEIWDLSEKYIPIAFAHLVLRAPLQNKSTEFCFDGKNESLRIGYLFPDLAPETNAYKWLMEIRRLRWQLKLVQQNEVDESTVASAHAAEQFEAFCANKRDDLMEVFIHFSPVQKEILKEHFFPRFPF